MKLMKDRKAVNSMIEKVEGSRNPILVIGLGGTGRDAVIEIKRAFADRFSGQDKPVMRKTAYLVFDSEPYPTEELSSNEYADITYPGIERLLQEQYMLPPDERAWIDPALKPMRVGGSGTGAVRQIGRIMLNRNYAKIKAILSGALATLAVREDDKTQGKNGRVEVVIVTGIGGGTGSGVFLDMAQIVRYLGKRITGRLCRITGYIVMPDAIIDKAKYVMGVESIIKHNGYAALKELDYWMHVNKHQTPYAVTYGFSDEISWKKKPFNTCILVSGISAKGKSASHDYKTVVHNLAENLQQGAAEENWHPGSACRRKPIGRYCLISEMSEQYKADLDNPDYAGMHLVRAGGDHPDYTNDWSLLPSPESTFLFLPVAMQ